MELLGGRYAVKQRLGGGDFFDTYEGLDTLLERPVFLKASKPPAPGMDATIQTAVIEAHLACWRQWARASLPGVPHVLEVAQRDQQVWIATDWVPAPSLHTLIAERTDLPHGLMYFVNRLLLGGLEVLSRIHEAGLVHGDISPGNILVRQGGHLDVFLADPAPTLWMKDPTDPGRRLVLGTAGFQAPEIVRSGSAINAATDVFALGAVIKATADQLGTAIPEEIAAMMAPEPYRRPSSSQAFDHLRRRMDGPRPEPVMPGSSGPSAGSSSSGPSPRYEPPPKAGFKPPRLLDSIADAAESIAGALGRLGSRPRGTPAKPASSPPPRPAAAPSSWDEVTRVASVPKGEEERWAETSRLMSVPMPSAPTTEKQTADFSVMAPADIAAGNHFFVEVWAAPSSERDAMLEEATRNVRMVERGRRAFLNLERDTAITVLLKLPDFEVEEPIETLGWNGEIRNVAFMAKAPSGLKPGVYPGMVKLLCGQAPFASISFDLSVVPSGVMTDPRARSRPAEIQLITRAFASYASIDRGEVLRRVQGIQAAGTSVFLDVIHLRAGEAWEPALYSEIDACDGFYLFWSRNAAKSEWVEREWRYALEHRGLDFINPLALEDPRLVSPPPELSSKHFNDMLLAFIKAEEPPAV
jgi:serine/threonine protein kinase